MRRIIRWFVRKHHERLRRTDIEVLWKSIREMHQARDVAEACFLMHIYNDYAWEDVSTEEIEQVIISLP